MSIISGSHHLKRRGTRRLAGVHVAVAILASFPCLDGVTAAEGEHDERPELRVPITDSKPVIDGKLDEPCWKDAPSTGPLEVTPGEPAKSSTEAFVLRDAEYLYLGVRCGAKLAAEGGVKPGEPLKGLGSIELMIDSNADRNSYYLIRINAGDGGKIATSYNEDAPPWRDRTWQPKLKSAWANGSAGWALELALPLGGLNKNKTLASEIGFNVRRVGTAGSKDCGWRGTSANPRDWGILTGFAARKNLPRPDYGTAGLNRWYRPPNRAGRTFLAEAEERTIALGPGSAHPATTGEVKLELEGFLLAGDPHSRGMIWDLAVDESQGELYVLSETKPARGLAEVRVFDRRGKYLRTIMPLNPTLPRSSVRDVCQKAATEGDAELVIPKLFETWGEFSIYGNWWSFPQKLSLAPDGDLIMSNIYRGILWRMKPDGSLPPEGWISIYNHGRNEPFDSATWTQDRWHVSDLKNYMPFPALHYPYFCFDPDGVLYVSAGQSSLRTKVYAYHFEVSQQGAAYHRQISGNEGRGAQVWKCKMHSGVEIEEQAAFGGFAEPSGLVLDGDHLIVADAGNNRLQVLGENGRPVASITHYQLDGKKEPLNDPTALAIDRDRCLYVLVGPQPRPENRRVERTLSLVRQDVVAAAAKPPEGPRKLIKLKSWQEPTLLAVSEPLHPDVLQIAVDAGVSPPLVWVANGAGLGSLVQLSGDDLAVNNQWADDGQTLSFPMQSGNQPILNIDPQTGQVYIEDDSDHRLKHYGTVYRLDQEGKVLKKWPPFFFDARGLKMTSPWFTLNYERHFRDPEEPLSIDSFFGSDGRVYRWKLGKAGVELLRFDRQGKPIAFKASGTNALFVDHPMQVNFWHDVYHGMDVDREGNIYYVAKVDVEAKARPVSPYFGLHRQINVYDADGNLKKRALLVLDCVRGIQVDGQGNLYVVYRPAERPWDEYLVLSKFSPAGGEPLWSRRWEGYLGVAGVISPPCHCVAPRYHQTLDGKGYLYTAAKYSVQVIECKTGKLVGEFGSYGNMDCQGPGSKYPHPELPFGTISAISVWRDRLFVVDVLNRRIVKCRIVYAEAEKKGS